MRGYGRTATALAGVLLLGASALALVVASAPVRADDAPTVWTASAESSGFRVSVVKPAALPSADEVAGLSMPFARTETDSSPIGRGIGSWLWPGEGVADVKSLLLLGLDPSTADAEIQARKRRHPGTDGCAPERRITTPAVPNPAGGGPLVPASPVINPLTGSPFMDPTDNPCGERAARTALQTIVAERWPDYPFWARSLWPPSRPGDARDARSLCEAPSAFPSAWELPSGACVPDAPRAGWTEARSTAEGNWSTAHLAGFVVPGIARASNVTALSRTEWHERVLVASTSVTIDDLVFLGAGGAEFVRIASLTSTATVGSDGRDPVATLEATGVTVTLDGRRYAARIARDRLEIADASLPVETQRQLTAALDALDTGLSFGGDDAGGAVDAAAGRTDARDPSAARVAAVSLDLGARASLEGATTLRLSIGVAQARAAAAASPAFVPPPLGSAPGADAPPPAGPVLGAPPVAGGGGVPAPPSARGPVVGPPVAGILPSEPVPVAVVVLAALAALVGCAALVAAGIWETLY